MSTTPFQTSTTTEQSVVWMHREAPLTTFGDIETELMAFERAERQRLGIGTKEPTHWQDPNPVRFERSERATTTLLFGGLTQMQDSLIQGALEGLGYRAQALETPDNDALRVGREFGNRGQCNPTYFTVGNLVKHLCELRDSKGMTTEAIVADYIFLTAGACGPCRFGTYATEYRKALRDAGFHGFRVLLFQQQGGLRQACGTDVGLELSPRFFVAVLKAVMAGDVLNVMGYRLRPYETEQGATDAALARARQLVREALANRRSVAVALLQCRSILRRVVVDRLVAKPKVSIIGEFWAMTTEGDGNYRLQRFLESEGAEVDIQPISGWLLYNIWQVRWDTLRRLELRGADPERQGLAGKKPHQRLWQLRAADLALRCVFKTYAYLVGLKHYSLPDLELVATVAHPYYDNQLRGGEGHMEVGKLIQTVEHNKAHLVVSVKPFGCMPSSGVSDGVQSLVTERYPKAIFCAIETTGDGAANAHSRVMMDLFKARAVARAEFAAALGRRGLDLSAVRRSTAGQRIWADALHYPRAQGIAGTAARLVAELPVRGLFGKTT